MDTKINKTPSYTGHRERMRKRILEKGIDSLADYEILEACLFYSIPRGDVKPLAKDLLKAFGSFSEVLNAPEKDLLKIKGIGEHSLVLWKILQGSARLQAREVILNQPVLSSWRTVLDYCHIQLAHEKREQFHILFLDGNARLIKDEVQQIGTVDHVQVYVRDIVSRALDLGAQSLILVHNHPSGNATPSKADIMMTRDIETALRPLGIKIYDHLIISKSGHTSLRNSSLL